MAAPQARAPTTIAAWPQFAATLALAIAGHLLLATTTTSALKVTASIPELVKLNDAFWLNCSHTKYIELARSTASGAGSAGRSEDEKDDDIYAIKWFKDNEEFYNYLPNANPKVSIYETNGIQLDQAKSHEGNVFISKADMNTEGEYRCEILSEAPSFETVRKSKHLRVYALPVRSPKIDILDSNGRPRSPKDHDISYAIGDKIDLVCNSAPSKPPARLRWYLNDREIQVPPTGATADKNSTSRRHRRAAASGSRQAAPAGYDVRVTPIEYRQHFKGIYSSHSTLSLMLQQDDLISNKISFKCLASMRQEVPFASKQLIVLMHGPWKPPLSSAAANPSGARVRRSLAAPLSPLSSDFQATIAGLVDNEAHVHHRQRPSAHRHSMSRLAPQQQPPQPPPQAATLSYHQQQQQKAASLLGNLVEEPAMASNQMWYIYEDADSTLGPSIIDKPEDQQRYIRRLHSLHNDTGALPDNANLAADYSGANQIPEFNRGDNLEFVQVLRDRQGRQRTHASNMARPRMHTPGSFVKSPHYSDELDTVRPVINWPPLDSGRLTMMAPGNLLVAIPLQTVGKRRAGDAKYVLPPRLADMNAAPAGDPADPYRNKLPKVDAEIGIQHVMLERLLNSINCTCIEGAIDTKMSWIVNDTPLDPRDTRLYPTRVSPDHRQSWTTVGLHVPSHQQVLDSVPDYMYPTPSTPTVALRTMMAQYYKLPEPRILARINAYYNQIKLTCQAMHSLLLYSSSETITFDFNPPTLIDGNSIDKPLLPSNVILATSASQSSSAHGWTMDTRSQSCYVTSLLSLVIFVYVLLQ